MKHKQEGFALKNLLGFTYFLIILIATIALLPNIPQANAATYNVTNTNDSGSGSLRQAIIDANNNPGADTIAFGIGSGPQLIVVNSPLPPLNAFVASPVTIDGTTQPGFSGVPLIEISGQNAGANAVGLRITGNAAGSTIKGLIINRFSAQGIFIDTDNVTVTGNYIGTNAAGTAAAANGGDGIAIFSGTSLASANNNTIGGNSPTDRNVISGNSLNGIGITAQVGGASTGNVIKGNYIGTNAVGTSAIANGGDGILINHADGGGPANASGNVIGGTNGTPDGACTGECNLISGNIANGIGLWHGGVSGSLVYGNYVGTNASGNGAIPNGNIGIEVNEAPNNTVGGITPANRNIFSGNGGSGVFLTGAAATGNAVQGNYIGTNAAGTAVLSNQKMGLGVGFSPGAIGPNSNTIGGTNGITVGGACTGACNLISGNRDNGIFITGSESYGHVILGNFIGLNAAGTGNLANGADGIGIIHTPNTAIGNGTVTGRNIVSGNSSNGIIIAGGASTGVRIDENSIGLSTTGLSMGNAGSGVAISGATDVAILKTAFYSNGRLAIDLDNNGTPNLNDERDGDGGANRLQNFPNIYSAKNIGSVTKIGGQFNGTPTGNYRLDFFASDGCNAGAPYNYGEGQTYIGTRDINTDQFGNTAWGYQPSTQVAGNKYITATATKMIGNTPAETSEFSQCILVNASKPALTNGANWFLKNGLTTGPGDHAFGYGFPSFFLMCAWDGNQPGVKLPVIYSGGAWYMRASYTTGTADLNFSYGSGEHQPVCGDWDGDGVDTVGVLAPNNTWLIRNSNSSGPADAGNFQFGPAGKPLVGDWDGDGDDTIGIAESNYHFYLRNTNNSGVADYTASYGHVPGYAVVGDWDGNGSETIGSVSIGGTWSIRNSNNSGAPNGEFQFGFPGTVPLIW